MNKALIAGVLIGIVLGMALSPQISSALYAIPPTNAWQTIIIDNEAVSPQDGNNTATAINYRDTLHLLTDGSILLNITQYP